MIIYKTYEQYDPAHVTPSWLLKFDFMEYVALFNGTGGVYGAGQTARLTVYGNVVSSSGSPLASPTGVSFVLSLFAKENDGHFESYPLPTLSSYIMNGFKLVYTIFPGDENIRVVTELSTESWDFGEYGGGNIIRVDLLHDIFMPHRVTVAAEVSFPAEGTITRQLAYVEYL